MTEIGSVYVRGDGNTVNEPEHPQGDQRASHTGLFELEPCAVKVARTVLRGEWHSDMLLLPDSAGSPLLISHPPTGR